MPEKKIKRKVLKKDNYVNPSDYLTDEEDGYTQEVRDAIDEKLLSAKP